MRAVRRMAATAVVIGLTVVACGGSDDAVTGSTVPGSTVDVTTTEAAPPTTVAPTTVAPTTVAPTTVVATTEAPTTTAEPAPEPTAFDLADLPGVISDLETVVASGDPLELARTLGGFPYEIPVPTGSTIARIDTVVRSDAAVREHEFSYSVVAPGGTVPDIDISLDGSGPGSAQIIEVWDPLMTELGFERANSTGSDPGDPGGPNSINHVYVPSAAAPTSVNGLTATPGNVFVWSSEDITGAASGLDPTDPVGGYQIDAGAELGASQPIGVPLLAAIAALLPLPDGTELTRATVRLESRPPTAFEIDRGARYVSISFEWDAVPGATVEEVAAHYADRSLFADDRLLPAEPSFFEEGSYEPAEIGVYGDTDRRLPLLLLRRYEGTLWIETPSDPSGPVTISYDVTLNPNDTELTAPTG